MFLATERTFAGRCYGMISGSKNWVTIVNTVGGVEDA